MSLSSYQRIRYQNFYWRYRVEFILKGTGRWTNWPVVEIIYYIRKCVHLRGPGCVLFVLYGLTQPSLPYSNSCRTHLHIHFNWTYAYSLRTRSSYRRNAWKFKVGCSTECNNREKLRRISRWICRSGTPRLLRFYWHRHFHPIQHLRCTFICHLLLIQLAPQRRPYHQRGPRDAKLFRPPCLNRNRNGYIPRFVLGEVYHWNWKDPGMDLPIRMLVSSKWITFKVWKFFLEKVGITTPHRVLTAFMSNLF